MFQKAIVSVADFTYVLCIFVFDFSSVQSKTGGSILKDLVSIFRHHKIISFCRHKMPCFVLREVLPCFRGREVDLFLSFVYNLRTKLFQLKVWKSLGGEGCFWGHPGGCTGGWDRGREWQVANSRQNFPAFRPQKMPSVRIVLFLDGIWPDEEQFLFSFFSLKGKIIITQSAYIQNNGEIKFRKILHHLGRVLYCQEKFHEFWKISHPHFSATAFELCGRNFGQ